MNPFYKRRFAVWFVPIALMYLVPPLLMREPAYYLIGLVLSVIWTVALVQLELRWRRFGRWMNRDWGT